MRLFVSSLCLLFAGHAWADTFSLESPDIHANQLMAKAQEYQGFGCDGGNLSPALQWHNPPAGTRSFAVTVYDPDAPTGSGWWHWVVFNIPADVSGLTRGAGNPTSGAAPAGAVQSRTDYGSYGFGGACPPVGDTPHRYQFKVYALDIAKLELPPDSSAALVGFMLHSHQLGVAELEARYQR